MIGSLPSGLASSDMVNMRDISGNELLLIFNFSDSWQHLIWGAISNAVDFYETGPLPRAKPYMDRLSGAPKIQL